MSTAASNSTGASVVYVTVPSMEVAESLAGMLVDPAQRLAACVNIVPGEVPCCAWREKLALVAHLWMWSSHG